MPRGCSSRGRALQEFLQLGEAADVADGERVAATASALDARFNPRKAGPVQVDDWSCSVHTTTWMLQSTGHNVTWTTVKNQMLATGRVSRAAFPHGFTSL